MKSKLHAGLTLKEVMKNRNISIEYLARRTGYSVRFINNVLNGTKPIIPDFAQHLQYSLDVDASFWTNLQSQYTGKKNKSTKENI